MQNPEENPFNLGRNFQPIPTLCHVLSTSVCVKAPPHQFLGVTEISTTDMRRLTTGIRSEKCVVRRFLRCAKVIECT